MAANFAMRGGADFLLALNAGRLRSMGEPSITSILALNEANSFTLEFATREIIPRANVPVIFGACAFDPRQNVQDLVHAAKKAGFAGIANFPTATLLPAEFRDELERNGIGFSRELEMLVAAKRASMVSLAYTHSVQDAEEAARAGIDLITIGLGWNHGGALGSVNPRATSTAIEEAAIHIDRAARAIMQHAPKAFCLVEGGPIVSPRHLEELCRFVNIDGYVGGSTIDRVPLEAAIENTTSAFKTVNLSPAQEKAERPLFPIHMSGRSEAIRDMRDRLLRLADDNSPIHLQLPEPSGARPIVETLHNLGRRRAKEISTITINPETAEGALLDLFGYEAGFRGGVGKTRLGILEVADGGTLMVRCEGGSASLARISELIDAIKRKRAHRYGGTQTYSVNVRLIVATGPSEPQLSGMSLLRLPPLSQRPEDTSSILDVVLQDLQVRLRRPLLRLDAASWRIVVDHMWLGDVEELRRCVEEAALSIEGNLITPMDLRLIQSRDTKRHMFASEKDWILDGLRRNRFRRTQTAHFLGISRKTLYNKIQRYALDHDSGEA